MADQEIITRQAKLTFTLRNEADSIETDRSITVDTQLTDPQLKTNAAALKTKFVSSESGVGVYHYMIQPTNWRDDDDEESAYVCTDVQCESISKTVTKFDI